MTVVSCGVVLLPLVLCGAITHEEAVELDAKIAGQVVPNSYSAYREWIEEQLGRGLEDKYHTKEPELIRNWLDERADIHAEAYHDYNPDL